MIRFIESGLEHISELRYYQCHFLLFAPARDAVHNEILFFLILLGLLGHFPLQPLNLSLQPQIGRASCRGRGVGNVLNTEVSGVVSKKIHVDIMKL